MTSQVWSHWPMPVGPAPLLPSISHRQPSRGSAPGSRTPEQGGQRLPMDQKSEEAQKEGNCLQNKGSERTHMLNSVWRSFTEISMISLLTPTSGAENTN